MPQKLLVLADLDDTLTDRKAAFDAWAWSFLSSFGLSIDAIDILRKLDRRGQCDRKIFLLQASEALDLPINLELELPRYRSATQNVRPFEGVPTLLGRIRGLGGSTIVVSNGVGHVQRAKLMSSGLMNMIDGVVISDEVGVEKPDPAIFELAVSMVDEPTTAWMVGDSFELDIFGAADANLATAWVSHGDSLPGDTLVPDIVCQTTVKCLAEVMRRYRALGS
jgi:putative hydrolase of the HAD superfamily